MMYSANCPRVIVCPGQKYPIPEEQLALGTVFDTIPRSYARCAQGKSYVLSGDTSQKIWYGVYGAESSKYPWLISCRARYAKTAAALLLARPAYPDVA